MVGVGWFVCLSVCHCGDSVKRVEVEEEMVRVCLRVCIVFVFVFVTVIYSESGGISLSKVWQP